MYTRRNILRAGAQTAALASLVSLAPAWARPASEGNVGLSTLSGDRFGLTIGRFPVRVDGRRGRAVGINGVLPAPLLRFREGQEVILDVRNTLDEDSSVHWHGLLVPFEMDGVPGVSFPGIKPGETFSYRFAVPQNGTYWYHSHSGLQEQLGLYGPIIIDPKGADPVAYDREYVLMLSDWSFEDPHRIFAKLKKMSHVYNFQQRTVGNFVRDVSRNGLDETLSERAMWGEMRMSPRDIADVTGATYRYLINGHATADNWNGVFNPGERVRLRIINGSAMTIFNVRTPDLPMTVVQADGLNVQPLEVDEFQIGVAETYDVVIQPPDARAYAFVAESIDRSGQAVATFGPQPGMRAQAPALRPVPTLTMKDMGMSHGGEGHEGAGHDAASHGAASADHAGHGGHGHEQEAGTDPASVHAHGGATPAGGMVPPVLGPGVDNIATTPTSRLHEPGIGLEDVPHRTLRYSQLRSLEPNPDTRPPGRELYVHLTSNMERYMWSFDGVKFSEITKPIIFHEGERLRMTMINHTMMPHPIHLHGMFFDLVNGGGSHMPRKHTVLVKPGEKLSVDISADAVGDWGFHCHLLYHMHAGMMQVVSVLPRGDVDGGASDGHEGHDGHHGARHGEPAARPHAPEAAPDHAAPDHSTMSHGEHAGHAAAGEAH